MYSQEEVVYAVVVMLTVKPEPVVQTPDRPALSEEEVERKSKSIIDEFLHINDYKVLRFTINSRCPFRCKHLIRSLQVCR